MKEKLPVLEMLLLLLLVLFIIASAAIAANKTTQAASADSGTQTVETMQVPAWNQSKSTQWNVTGFSVYVDGSCAVFKKGYPYVNSNNLAIMLPVDICRRYCSCAACIYDENRILLQKGDKKVELNLNQDTIYVDGQEEKLLSGIAERDGVFYINAEVLQDYFDYQIRWDPFNRNLSLVNQGYEDGSLPSYYNYRDVGRLSAARNQGKLSTCWAFASLTALSTSLLPRESEVFSVDNMAIDNGYSSAQSSGGDYTRAIAYLASWNGPVLESDDPYDNKLNPDAVTVKHIQEVQIIDSKRMEDIKRAVFLYGGVESAFYISVGTDTATTAYYEDSTCGYYYKGTKKPNHDVVIVGWDDHYSRDNFATQAPGDGAFICMNSWGSDFGDDGLFYISYYDSNIGGHNVVYTQIEDTDNYDSIHQSDLCGWVGQIGYEYDSAYFANVYTADTSQNLEAVGFYATGPDTSYEVYVVPQFSDEQSFQNMEFLQAGSFQNAGYYTVRLNLPVALEKGTRYAVIIKIKTPGSVHPVAIEYAAGKATQNVVITDGEGYLSSDADRWEHVEETKCCNICLKTYTDDR